MAITIVSNVVSLSGPLFQKCVAELAVNPLAQLVTGVSLYALFKVSSHFCCSKPLKAKKVVEIEAGADNFNTDGIENCMQKLNDLTLEEYSEAQSKEEKEEFDDLVREFEKWGLENKQTKSHQSVNEIVSSLLPKSEVLKSAVQIEDCCSLPRVFKVSTTDSITDYHYLYKAYPNDTVEVRQKIEITQYTSKIGVGPRVVGCNVMNSQILVEYIECEEWPSFSISPDTYFASMKQLRKFHGEQSTYPKTFSFSDNALRSFFCVNMDGISHEQIPVEFWAPSRVLSDIQNALLPWLKNGGRCCYGAFSEKNVLLKWENFKLYPYLIGFGEVQVGHPYFDVCSFTRRFEDKDRFQIFKAYLGGEPTREDMAHFELLDFVFDMRVGVDLFKRGETAQAIKVFNKLSEISENELFLKLLKSL